MSKKKRSATHKGWKLEDLLKYHAEEQKRREKRALPNSNTPQSMTKDTKE